MSNEIDPPTLDPSESIMIAAFEGWNDAGSAASAALDHLVDTWGAAEYATLDSEEFHDFQVNRPAISRLPTGDRFVSWPGTIVSTTSAPNGSGRSLALVRGIEPSMRWRRFVGEILDHASELGVTTLITAGALLVDAPHTRPLPIFVTSEDSRTRDTFDLERSDYDGPTGILGILGHEASLRGIRVLSIWVGIPHYVGHPPSPKGTMALLGQIERFLGVSINLADLPYESQAWQRGADELAEDDEEVADHVKHLEELMDEASLPEASGEAIAAEFEQFLRRRDGGPGK